MSDQEDSIICTLCSKVETDATKVLECVQCHQCHHFKCKKIIGNAIRKMKSQQYFCSVPCKEIHMRSMGTSAAENLVIEEMRKVISEVQELRKENVQTRKALEKTIEEVELSQQFLSNKFETMMDELRSVKVCQENLKVDVGVVRERYDALTTKVDELEKECDRLGRSAVSRNAIILGVPVLKNEIVRAVAMRIGSVLGCELSDAAVVDAVRLHDPKEERKNPPIKVIFSEQHFKETVFSKKKGHGQLLVSALGDGYAGMPGKIMIRDEMTPHGLSLLRETKDVQESLELQYVWPGRHGAILVKKSHNSKVEIIRCRKDIQDLCRNLKKRAYNSSGLNSSSLSSSSVHEPSPKRR
ncbi:uncharacterized protein LOC115259800 [Aedes albopictus]|uniref:FP protein C-terminal domain-containing protein n=1 Tax=Aedes albopictus TaxID=7160 RepID=A0ABM1Y416_AEDAL